MTRNAIRLALVIFASLPGCLARAQDNPPLGLFESQTDVGLVMHPGAAKYDTATGAYIVSGSGENMWVANDDFHFVWKKITAQDLSLTADIAISGVDGDAHRKAVLMIRQSLDPDSAYVDVARHGEGLTSMQFRETKGAVTREVESNVSGPKRLRIEKQGNRFYWWIAGEKEELQFAGGAAKVELQAPFYVGIGVCAHNKDAIQEVAFTNVELATSIPPHRADYSTVETVLASGDARAGYVSSLRLTSPGWSAAGHTLTFEAGGMHREAPFTPLRTAAPVGPVLPGIESKYTYFSAPTNGTLQIWRKLADGSELEQFTKDEFNNVSPALSPDGKSLLFLSYPGDLKDMPMNGEVELRVLSIADKQVKILARFVGGQGSLGPAPWSPDGRRAVFVSYQSVR